MDLGYFNKFSLYIVLIFSFLTQNTYASNPSPADSYNSYRWNRKNWEAKNDKIDTNPWYEWWYYKVVDSKTNEAFYFVYGVVNPWDIKGDNKASRSFVSFGSFKDGLQIENIHTINDFYAHYESPYVQVGKANVATEKFLTGDIVNSKGDRVRWNLEMNKEWGYNAMGWGMGVSNISNIYWYPAQASARMTGSIEINDKRVFLENAPAYQDRNWGNSFPKWWTWIVSNEFEGEPDAVLAVGGGLPKALNRVELVNSMSIGLRLRGKEYAFRTNDGDRINIDVRKDRWNVTATKLAKYKIEIRAYAPPEKFLVLPFQTPAGQTFYDYEALQGKVLVSLFEPSFGRGKNLNNLVQVGWKLKAEILSRSAGIEYGSFDQK